MCEPSSPTLCDESRGALTKNTSCLSVQLYSLLPFCPPWKQTFFSKQRILPSKTKHSIQGIGSHTKIPHIMTVMSSLSRVCAVSKNIMRRVYYGGGGAQAYVMCNRTNHYAKHNLRQKEMYALLRNMCASIDEE